MFSFVLDLGISMSGGIEFQ